MAKQFSLPVKGKGKQSPPKGKGQFALPKSAKAAAAKELKEMKDEGTA